MQDANTIDLIERFNEKHSLEVDGQLHMLAAEVGELHDALLTGENVYEELGDCLFVAWSIDLLSETQNVEYDTFNREIPTDEHVFALLGEVQNLHRANQRPVLLRAILAQVKGRLYEIAGNECVDIEQSLRDQTLDNMEKDASKNGDKVSKE